MKNNRNIGFTLVETMIMLAIIGFLTAIIVFNMSNMLAIRAKGAARRLVTDIVWAKNQATTTNVKCGVIFYPATDKYIVYSSTVTTPIADPVTHKPMIRDFTAGDFRKVNIVSASFGGNSYIEFDPIGRNFTGGSVVFSYGSEQYTVWVEDNTGRAYWTKP
jgi:Tfp pilus assembly protein FimT